MGAEKIDSEKKSGSHLVRPSQQTKPLIIVVDDEVEILENYKILLEDQYRVISFTEPREFVSSLLSPSFEAPALLITDLKMPSMDGLEMIRKANEKGVHFPFILMTGFLNKQSAIEALDVGAYRLLEKPADFDDLSRSIDQLLVEYDMGKIREEIRGLTLQIRELYSTLRLVMTQYVPEDIMTRMVVDAPDGMVKTKMSFENLVDQLESRLDSLLKSERILNEMRIPRNRSV